MKPASPGFVVVRPASCAFRRGGGLRDVSGQAYPRPAPHMVGLEPPPAGFFIKLHKNRAGNLAEFTKAFRLTILGEKGKI
jgi:hypothetical protein